MLGYSLYKHQVYTFPKTLTNIVTAKTNISSKILLCNDLSRHELDQIIRIQGSFALRYLLFRYGSPQTYILLAYTDRSLAHIQWLVPAKKIRSRYSFVPPDSYSLISCLTAPQFRGLNIYPNQIQHVLQSDIPANSFWIWAVSNNHASLRGIQKAGGIMAGKFIQQKWLYGCFSKISDCSVNTNILV